MYHVQLEYRCNKHKKNENTFNKSSKMRWWNCHYCNWTVFRSSRSGKPPQIVLDKVTLFINGVETPVVGMTSKHLYLHGMAIKFS